MLRHVKTCKNGVPCFGIMRRTCQCMSLSFLKISYDAPESAIEFQNSILSWRASAMRGCKKTATNCGYAWITNDSHETTKVCEEHTERGEKGDKTKDRQSLEDMDVHPETLPLQSQDKVMELRDVACQHFHLAVCTVFGLFPLSVKAMKSC